MLQNNNKRRDGSVFLFNVIDANVFKLSAKVADTLHVLEDRSLV